MRDTRDGRQMGSERKRRAIQVGEREEARAIDREGKDRSTADILICIISSVTEISFSKSAILADKKKPVE